MNILSEQVWGVEEMVYYAESMAKDIPLPKSSQYVHDDPQQVYAKFLKTKMFYSSCSKLKFYDNLFLQMGGDFIIDKDGVVRYMYCSKKSIDRPSVQDILDNLKVSAVSVSTGISCL